MHDAHLASNGELSSCGRQVTDLIVELRDSSNHNNWHFTPCNRNVRCKYTPQKPEKTKVKMIKSSLKCSLVFRPAHIFQCYDIIGRVLPTNPQTAYIFPNRRNWILIGYLQVGDFLFSIFLSNCLF